MTQSLYQTTYTSFEKKLARLYIILLPVRMFMPFEGLKLVLGPLATYVDFLISLWGIFLWLQRGRGFDIGINNKPLYSQFRNTMIFLNFSSFIMAIVMYSIYGNHNGVSPFKGIVAMEVFYFHYIFMLLYNIRVFSILSYEELISAYHKACRILLVLAYIQVGVMMGIGAGLYDAAAGVIGGLNKSNMLPKLCLTGSEGASAGGMMAILIFPFLLAKNIAGDKKALYELLIWMIPLYFTHSSTGFILFFIDILAYFYLMLKGSVGNKRQVQNLFAVFIILLLGFLVASSLGLLGGDVIEEINYLLFQKIGDNDNGSTVSRQVPLIIDWGAFTEMPLFGVGNGLQGYFFNDYFPTWALSVQGSDVGEFYDVAQKGISNGGVFWGGYLSGYGIVGCILAISFAIRLWRQYKSRRISMGIFADVFLIAIPAFIITGFQGEIYASFYVWIIIALPFMSYNFQNK